MDLKKGILVVFNNLCAYWWSCFHWKKVSTIWNYKIYSHFRSQLIQDLGLIILGALYNKKLFSFKKNSFLLRKNE
jgi:hypothetical protein